ncbi:MAG: translocation/assembly module TamB, partial [Cytophagaceae bacterium]|nr:translocation/assembly module TamB [Gemmatimonadaceae bacterium]
RIARLRERADSLRLAQRAANDPAAELAADLQRPERRRRRRAPIDVPPVGRDSISGSFDVAGEARGHVKDLDVNATVSTPGFVWGGNAVGAGRLVTRWVGIGTPNDTAHAQGGFAALRAAGFEFDSTQLKADYHRGAGTAQVVIFPGDTAVYRLEAAYLVHGNEGEVHLNDMRLQLDSTTWRLAHPGAVSWRGQGLTIDSLELLDAGGARIAINGELPDVDPGRLEVHLERVRIAPWLAILQSDVLVDGLLDVRGTWDGTRRDPRIDGTVALRTPTYNGTPFPELHTTLAYAARQMRVDAAIRRDTGLELATITGTVPIDLTLGDSLATRLLESTPLALVIEGDSIPLSPIMEFTDAVTELTGRAFGRVEVAGTWGKPDLSGGLGLDIPRVRLTSTGVLMQQVAAALHMSGDTMVVDSLLGHSRGTLRGKGNVVFTSLANPTLDLTFDAAEVRVLDDERGELQATGTIAAKGPLDTLAVTGSMAITRGVIYIPDPEQFDVIATDDPAIFAVTDTATAQALGLEVPSPILRNLRLDVDIDVRRGTFGRSPDANVEVYGKLEVRTEPGVDAYLVTGALFTDQGTYTFLGKRFDVSRGSVRFLGGDEELNPALQILARYEVRQAGRAPLDIRVIIGGTLDRPTVSLESDAQPPLSQSDLIAFLAFGRSSSSLLGSSGSGLEGGGAGGSSLAGNVRALATKQLASVALGVLVDEAKSGLATRTGADVLHITPAELPAELSLGTFQTLLRGTELEIGEYLDRHTFLIGRIRPSLAVPGASLEHRLNERLSVRGTVETRYQSQPPSLSAGLAPRTIQLVGALLTWRIGW